MLDDAPIVPWAHSSTQEETHVPQLQRSCRVRSAPSSRRSPAHEASRQVLLTLDNREHLFRSVADPVPVLLPACLAKQVLAASRVPLHGRGERQFPLASRRRNRRPASPYSRNRRWPPLSQPGAGH